MSVVVCVVHLAEDQAVDSRFPIPEVGPLNSSVVRIPDITIFNISKPHNISASFCLAIAWPGPVNCLLLPLSATALTGRRLCGPLPLPLPLLGFAHFSLPIGPGPRHLPWFDATNLWGHEGPWCLAQTISNCGCYTGKVFPSRPTNSQALSLHSGSCHGEEAGEDVCRLG